MTSSSAKALASREVDYSTEFSLGPQTTMPQSTRCPICLNSDGGPCYEFSTAGRDSSGFDCAVCGKYEISRTALAGPLDSRHATLTPVQRAALSYRLRTAINEGADPIITTEWLRHHERANHLPTPAIQAANLIRLIGDHALKSGEPYFPEASTRAVVGVFSSKALHQLIKQVELKGYVLNSGNAKRVGPDGTTVGSCFSLTLDGWDRYEAEKHGKVAGKYGFIAMPFGDAVLDPFVGTVVKPAVKDGIGYELLDMRDVARAGIIDNLLRTQIRDAAFVIVDLTHDNSGAYWEAGYAEGLGKPVVYICEGRKFEDAKTHFDTNHCTTVLWSNDAPDDFRQQLIATLRRSLNLFPATP